MNGCPNPHEHEPWECSSALSRFGRMASAKADKNGCVLWQGALNRLGLGIIRVHGRQLRAHVFSWMIANQQEFPVVLCEQSFCSNRSCVNPAHVRPFHAPWECPAAALAFQRGRHEIKGGCHLWTGTKTDKGYGTIRVHGKAYRAHVFALMLRDRADRPTGACSCHRCDTPACVNPDHLWWGAHAENMRDAAVKERFASKLTAEDVKAIRLRFAEGWSDREIADVYPVHATTIREIRRGINWAWVA